MKKEKEYFYPTLGNLKNADCFDLNKWQWEYIKEPWLEKKHHKWEDINIIGITKIINAIAMYPKYIRYSLKQHQITHEFIMTGNEYWEIIKGWWEKVDGYNRNNDDALFYTLTLHFKSIEWFQTAKHCKCPPEAIK